MSKGKNGKHAWEIERLLVQGHVGTSYYFARKANCTPSYAYKVLEGFVRRGLVGKTEINGKYIYAERGLR